MEIDVLLDTNIVIYLLNQEQRYIEFLYELRSKRFGMSVVSYIEVLVGISGQKEVDTANALLDQMEIVPLHTDVATQVATVLRKRTKLSMKDSKLADIVIAQTALALHVPLITNNAKDFAAFQDLELIVP